MARQFAWTTTASWGSLSDRTFHVGLDRGMLYAPSLSAWAAWPGLVSVDPNLDAEESDDRYIDGVQFGKTFGLPAFTCSVTAFSYPKLMETLTGNTGVPGAPGLVVSGGVLTPFDFSYRTLIGDGAIGDDLGYIVHIVRNCYAKVPKSTKETINDSPDATDFEWEFSAMPTFLPNLRPTAYFAIDSREADPTKLTNLEKALYGFNGSTPMMPSFTELKTYLAG